MHRRNRFATALAALVMALALLNVAGLAQAQVAASSGAAAQAAAPAVAASDPGRGPAAATDGFDNEFVFWRGADGDLWETVHTAKAKSWGRSVKLKMGKLGSEPTVAITNQVFRSGGTDYNAQYVYWRGGDGFLWFAYWTGKWHGPVRIEAKLCSQPSATFVGPPYGAEKIVVFWKGLPDPRCGSDSLSNNLWYLYSTKFPTSNAAYTGPTLDHYARYIGSSPSITTVRGTCAPSAACPQYVVIAWEGTSGSLWQEVWDQASSFVSGPYKDTKAGKLGSAPSVGTVHLPVSSPAPVDTWDVVWRGGNGRLWFAHPEVTRPNVGAIELSNSGSLDSAPTLAETFTGLMDVDFANMFIFWRGGAPKHNLWEAFYNGNKKAWHLYDVGKGPL